MNPKPHEDQHEEQAVKLAVHEERISTVESGIGAISEKIEAVDEKLDRISSNDLPHLKEGITVLTGKVDNAMLAWEAVTKKLETHWPKSLAVLLTFLASAALSLLGIVITLIFTGVR